MPSEPWYHEGLRFRCLGCGGCCTGDPGYVWVSAGEIAVLAARLAMEVEEFQATYVRTLGSRKSLVEFANGDCVFFDSQTRRCKVYDARPEQCRTWPFWQSNVRSAGTWDETCRECPGSGHGPLVAREQIERRVATVRV